MNGTRRDTMRFIRRRTAGAAAVIAAVLVATAFAASQNPTGHPSDAPRITWHLSSQSVLAKEPDQGDGAGQSDDSTPLDFSDLSQLLVQLHQLGDFSRLSDRLTQRNQELKEQLDQLHQAADSNQLTDQIHPARSAAQATSRRIE